MEGIKPYLIEESVVSPVPSLQDISPDDIGELVNAVKDELLRKTNDWRYFEGNKAFDKNQVVDLMENDKEFCLRIVKSFLKLAVITTRNSH